MVREEYPDGSAFRYWAGENWVYPGEPVANIPGFSVFVIPERCAGITLALWATDVDARVQITYDPASAIYAGQANWVDSGMGSTGGTASDGAILTPGWDITGVRLFIDAAALAGGEAHFEISAFPRVDGRRISTPFGGSGTLRQYKGTGFAVPGTWVKIAAGSDQAIDDIVAADPEACGLVYGVNVLPPDAYIMVIDTGDSYALLEDGVGAVAGNLIIPATITPGRSDCVAPPAPYTLPDWILRKAVAVEDVVGGLDQRALVHLV